MSYLELASSYQEWFNRSRVQHTSIFDPNVDTVFKLHTVAQLEQERAEFEKFIPAGKRRELARDLALALDTNKVQIKDLDAEGMPAKALEHSGGKYSFDEPDKILASVLKYFEVLINVGFTRNPDEDYKYNEAGFEFASNETLQPVLQEFIKEIYAFIAMVYQEAQSLASYLPIKGRIGDIAGNQAESIVDGDEDGFDALKDRISEYLGFLDRSAVEDPKLKSSLAKYANSWNSYSIDELLNWDGPVDYRSLSDVEHLIDEEINQALDDHEKMTRLRQEYVEMVANIDTRVEDLHSRTSQRLLIRFIALREFFAVAKENYEEWAKFRDRAQYLYEEAMEDADS